MASNDIVVHLKGDTQDYTIKLQGAAAATKKFSDRLVVTMGDVVNMAKSAWQMMQAPINAYKESERAVNELNQSMVNQGVFTADLSNKYQKMADALMMKTTFDDEQIVSAQGVLQSFIGQREVSEQLVKATLDLAAAKKMDLSAAAEMVGKTIGTETNALARSGIELEKNMSTSEKMATVIEKLNGKWEGQAEAQAKGLGSLEQLNNIWGEFLEGVGKQLAPFITIVVSSLKDLVISLNNGGQAFEGVKTIVEGVAKGLAGAKAWIVAWGSALGIVGGIIADVIGKIMDGNFSGLLDTGKIAVEEFTRIGVETADQFNKDIALINDAARQAELAKQEEYQKMEIQSIQNQGQKKVEEKKTWAMKLFNLDQKELQEKKEGFAVAASMQSSQFGILKAMGKAAALANIAISTPDAAMKAYNAFAFFPPLATAMAAAVYAFGAEQAAQVLAANQGGIVTGGRAGMDSVPALLTPGELVVPQQNFEEVVRATRSSRGEGGASELIISFKDELMDFIETKLIERQRLGIAIRTV